MNCVELQRIPETFKKHGFVYNLIKREKNIALYKQCNKDGSLSSYEVHKVRFKKSGSRKLPDGQVLEYPDMEILAGDEDFGMYGWAFMKLENAEKRYAQLLC